MQLNLPALCVICRLEIREEDFTTERAPVFLIGKQVTAAHALHFFDDAGQPGPAYEQNLTLLALAYSKAEGFVLPGYTPEELPTPKSEVAENGK
jgi:hypothetical protein